MLRVNRDRQAKPSPPGRYSAGSVRLPYCQRLQIHQDPLEMVSLVLVEEHQQGAEEFPMMPKIGWNSIFISSVKYAHRGVSSAA